MAYTTNLSESPILKLMVHFLPTFGSHYYSLAYLHLLFALRRYSGMYMPIRAAATMITNTKATTTAITATLLHGRDGNLAGGKTKSVEFDVEGWSAILSCFGGISLKGRNSFSGEAIPKFSDICGFPRYSRFEGCSIYIMIMKRNVMEVRIIHSTNHFHFERKFDH